MNKTIIFLIRHAETEDNKAGIPLGQNDSPLTDNGKKQAAKTADYLSQYNIQAVYTSSLGRAKKTAEVIGNKLGLKMVTVPQFKEISLGNWLGKNFDEINVKGMLSKNIRPPKGENIKDVQKRVMPKFDHLVEKHQGETIVIIAHSGINKVILGSIQNLPITKFFETNQDNCGINELEKTSTGYKINRINYIKHLKK